MSKKRVVLDYFYEKVADEACDTKIWKKEYKKEVILVLEYSKS